MSILKYIPYLFLLVALFFAYNGIEQYVNGKDGLPYLIVAVSAVVYFFIRLRLTRRYDNPNPKE